MNGWINEWMDGQMDRLMDRWMNNWQTIDKYLEMNGWLVSIHYTSQTKNEIDKGNNEELICTCI